MLILLYSFDSGNSPGVASRAYHRMPFVKDSRFFSVGTPKNIWAVSAIHGDVDRLITLHNTLYKRLRPGDRIIYLGNYVGYGDEAVACIDEILTFRRLVLSIPGMLCSDMVYLRGRQEEMWQKLLQLQFAPDPGGTLLWMLGNGLSNTLYSYGLSPHDGIEACHHGIMGLTRWTNSIRETLRRHPGHEIFGTHLTRAAHTDETAPYPMLFVHAGLDASRALGDQGDTFWWASAEFETIDTPYLPWQKVVRGYDPGHKGVVTNCVTATIDGGCGFGGKLICAGFEANGCISDMQSF
jgi:hypothetical protein